MDEEKIKAFDEIAEAFIKFGRDEWTHEETMIEVSMIMANAWTKAASMALDEL